MQLAVVLVSGGLDSVTLAHWLAAQNYRLHLLSVNYGQRHHKELDFARSCAVRLGAVFEAADLRDLGRMFPGNALTGEVAVPHGHYADTNMTITVVPNRNAVMLSVAFALAAARGASLVGAAMHAGDHHIYPDCRPAFVRSFEMMEQCALEGLTSVRLYTPFLNLHKADIVTKAAELGVPLRDTWSCYEGAELHCGRCGTCVERREAFEISGVPDPTRYRES